MVTKLNLLYNKLVNAAEMNRYQDIDITKILDSSMGDSRTVQAVSLVYNYISTLDVKSLNEDAWTTHLNKAASLFFHRSRKGSGAVHNSIDSSTPASRKAINNATGGDFLPKTQAQTSGFENEIPRTLDAAAQSPHEASRRGEIPNAPDVSTQSAREAYLASSQSEEDESQCRSTSRRSSSMNASSGDASGESGIGSHDETDTHVRKRTSARISTRSAGADEDKDVSDDDSDSITSKLQPPRANSALSARKAQTSTVRSETDNKGAQKSADEAANSPANAIESHERTDTRLREQGSTRASPRSASVAEDDDVSYEDSVSICSMLQSPQVRAESACRTRKAQDSAVESESDNQGAQKGVDESPDGPANAVLQTSTPPEYMNAVEEAADQSGFRVTHRERDGSRLFCELARPRTEGFRNVIEKGDWLEGTYVNSTLKSNLLRRSNCPSHPLRTEVDDDTSEQG